MAVDFRTELEWSSDATVAAVAGVYRVSLDGGLDAPDHFILCAELVHHVPRNDAAQGHTGSPYTFGLIPILGGVAAPVSDDVINVRLVYQIGILAGVPYGRRVRPYKIDGGSTHPVLPSRGLRHFGQ